MFSSAYLKAKRTCCYVCDRVALRCRDGTAESDVSLRQKVGLLTDQLTVRMYGSQASALNQVIKLYGGRFRLVQNRLKAILVVGFYVRDFFQCSLELFPIEESGAGLDVVAAGKPICEHCGHELFHGDMVPGCKLSGALVQILGYCDTLAHIPSPSILRKNSRGVST
jgi:hypothetical protein